MLRIDNEGSGTALDLRVKSGEAPMNVNSTTRVNALYADQVDGKSAANIGVNGRTMVDDESDADSASSKYALALCPNANMVVVGTGYMLRGAEAENASVKMVFATPIDRSNAPRAPDAVMAHAVETKPVAGNWSVVAEAICAKEGTP